MTTKKQRRANVAAKRELFDAETRRMGLVAQTRDHARLALRKSDKEHGIERSTEDFNRLLDEIVNDELYNDRGNIRLSSGFNGPRTSSDW